MHMHARAHTHTHTHTKHNTHTAIYQGNGTEEEKSIETFT